MPSPHELTPVTTAAVREASRGVSPWLMVFVCVIGISTGPAAFGLASLGLFIGALEQVHGWSRTEISSAVSILMVCTAFSLPVVGAWIDRFGIRPVLIPSVIVLGLCLIAIPHVRELWQFYAIYVAMGTLAVGSNSMGYMRALTSWFDRSRGLAIGIAGSGTALGFAYVPLFGQYLIDAYGWQAAYFGLGLVILVVTLPLAAFALREAPRRADAAAPDAAPAGKTLGEAIRGTDFWVLMAIFVTVSAVLYGLLPHLVPLLVDRGATQTQAAQMASAFGLAAFAGRIIIGFMVDRFDARRIALAFMLLSALGLPLLSLDLPAWGYLTAAVLLGGSLGAEVDMLAYLTSRYFGLRSFAQIFGFLFGVVMLAMGMGPLVFGAVYDATHSYTPLLLLGAPVCALAGLLTLFLNPYAERARGGPVSAT